MAYSFLRLPNNLVIVFPVCPQIRERHNGNVVVNFLSQVFFFLLFLGYGNVC